MNLYMIGLGGQAKSANIEIHDIQFAVTETIEEAIPLLKDKWYGLPHKLHMDSYKKIEGADGFKISLSPKTAENHKHLFFVNMGGYDKERMQERHRIFLVVASSAVEARKKTLEIKIENELGLIWEETHVDEVVNVERKILSKDKYYIHLEKDDKTYPLRPDWYGYRRLDQEG